MEKIQTTPLPDMASVWEETLHWQPNSQQNQQFQRLYELVLAGNRQFNLTRITDSLEFWEKHLWDSLRGIAAWLQAETNPADQKVIDIGTGAGFPGIPVAIARPEWTVTLLDATRKKVTFLKTLPEPLGLSNLRPWIGRVEQIGQHRQHRGTYDLALVRAVGPASVCAEYALPLLQLAGIAVLYRGQWTDAEAIALATAVTPLGGTLEAVEAFTTPVSQSVRHCLYLRKVASTPPEFPRPIGMPAQKPL